MSKHSSHGATGAASGGLGAVGVNTPDHSSVRDAVGNHGGGGGGLSGGRPDPGESVGMFGDQPLDLVFGNPAPVADHGFSLAAIPVGGGVTMSIVALIGTIVVALVILSMATRMVVARCSR